MKVSSSYIIASSPRTGSLLLCYGLEDTKIAGRPSEFFSPILYKDWLERWHLDPKCSAQDFFHASLIHGTTPNGVHGVKIHYRHLSTMSRYFGINSRNNVLPILYPQAKFVNIRRCDVRAQALSLYRADITQEWHLTNRHPKSLITPPELDPDAVLALEKELYKEQQQWEKYFETHNIKPLVVDYEVLSVNYTQEIARVLDFLELDSKRASVLPPPRLVKQADRTTAQWRIALENTTIMPNVNPSIKSQKDIIIIDNFYDDPHAVRAYALQQPYYTPYQDPKYIVEGTAKSTWWATRFKQYISCPFKSSKNLIEHLERLTGERIDMTHWCAPYPVTKDWKPDKDKKKLDEIYSCLWNCCFHVKPEIGQRLGDGVHSHTDADNWNAAGENGWAGLIYLSPGAPLEGGLYLWKNRDIHHQYDWMTPAGNWQLVDRLGNVFNRLILCRGKFPHSGANGWGDSIETGRMFQTFFFRTLKE